MIYMCNLKLQHISKHNKKEADTGLEKKLVVTSKWERSDRGVGEWEAQTIGCKTQGCTVQHGHRANIL